MKLLLLVQLLQLLVLTATTAATAAVASALAAALTVWRCRPELSEQPHVVVGQDLFVLCCTVEPCAVLLSAGNLAPAASVQL